MSERIDLAMPPCPWWCSSNDSDHACEYDSTLIDDTSALSRVHTHQFGDVAVVQYETNRGGAVTLDAPTVSIYVETAKDASAAIRLSIDLDAAASLLRRLESEVTV